MNIFNIYKLVQWQTAGKKEDSVSVKKLFTDEEVGVIPSRKIPSDLRMIQTEALELLGVIEGELGNSCATLEQISACCVEALRRIES